MLPVQGSDWVAVVGDDEVQRRRSCRIVVGEYGQGLLNVSCAPKKAVGSSVVQNEALGSPRKSQQAVFRAASGAPAV